MTGRLSTNEKKRLGRQALNDRLGQNLKARRSDHARRNVRRGLAIAFLLVAFGVFFVAIIGR